MDALTKIRKRFSMGRRSSVDPIKFPTDDSCLMATEEKRPKSGIPRIMVTGGSKRRSSSAERTWNVSKTGYDGTLPSSSSAGLLFTPQNPVTPRVSISARKAIDCISQLSAKSHTARKEQRTALDKNAQIRLSRHVASYLNKTGLVGDLLAGGQGRAPSAPIQSNDLKNMNKGAFIAIFNLLYKKLGSRRKVEFNSSNYHESIPNIAKKLGYPGVIYKSHLLTPNTPHSWPYVIAFLGWLVDLVLWQEPVEIALESTSPDTEAMVVKEFYMKSYLGYINEEREEPLEEHVMEFRGRVHAIKNIQPDLIQELVIRRDQLKSVVDSDQDALIKLKEQREKVNQEVVELVSEIENLGVYNSNLVSETTELRNQIVEREKRRGELIAMIEQQKRDKEALKLICSNQKLSKPEWDQLVADNKATREGNQMLIEMCEQTKKIVDSLDLKISAIRNKLHKVWFEIVEASMLVQADSAQVSRLSTLINNFSHLAPEAPLLYEDILKTLDHAISEIRPKVEQEQARARAMQDKIHEAKVEYDETRKKKDHVAKELEALRSEWQLTANKLKEEENQLSRQVHQVLQRVKYIRESSLGDCFEELEKTKKRYQEKVEELEATKQRYASDLSQMQEMAASFLKVAMEKLNAFLSDATRLSRELAKYSKIEE